MGLRSGEIISIEKNQNAVLTSIITDMFTVDSSDNTTFNNISVISWLSVLFVEET
jgi:hypothetical protein